MILIKKSKILFLVCFIFLFFTLSLYSQSFGAVKPKVVSPKLTSLGGGFVSQATGFETLFTNPAALTQVSKQSNYMQISIHSGGPIFDLIGVLTDEDITTEFINFIIDQGDLYIDLDLTGPISFGLVDNGFGFGIFNRTIVNVNIPTVTHMEVFAGEEIFITGAYGVEVFNKNNHIISMGLQLKGFSQTLVGISGNALDVLDMIDSLDNLDVPIIITNGFGFDFGLLYNFKNIFQTGLVYQDIFSPVTNNYYNGVDNFTGRTKAKENELVLIDSNIDIGILFNIPFPESWKAINHLHLMLDYKNLLDLFKPFARNAILNLAVGAELFLLDVVSLRAGINEGYLATGVGIDFTVFQLDFAMYGKELGFEPGSRPVFNMDIGLTFKY